jgi:putative transposase
MRTIYHRLLLLIVGASQKELARYVRYLKTENQILRIQLPARVAVTPQQRRRLVRFAQHLGGRALHELVTIVHPDTLRRWIREERKGRKLPAARGRGRTSEDIRKLILKLARETGWGYTRILGELKKLGIKSISRNTVKNILRQHGFEPGPQRGPGTWDDFLKLHAATLWQCDFFSKKVLTPKGFRDLFVLVFLHVGTRRVVIAPATYHPNRAWMQQQAAAFLNQSRAGKGTLTLMHDRDSKFTADFDRAFASRCAGSTDCDPSAEHRSLCGAVHPDCAARMPGPLCGLRRAAHELSLRAVRGALPQRAATPGSGQ